MLRRTAQISFSELYIEPSTRRSEFFKIIKHLDPLGKDGEINKKNISKSTGNKRQYAYNEISLSNDNVFDLLV
ncbi:MAG: hypothetical protein ACMUEL_07745 [Flavobacteriales bacterium Tduv]